MKRFFKTCFKNPMVIVFVVICIFFGLPALGTAAEVNRYAVVTGIGIDPLENSQDIEVSLLTFTPVAKQAFTENYNVIVSRGRSISEALDYAGLHIGREVGLSHIRNVVLNKKLLLDNDFSKYLDYLSRNKNFELSTKLIVTEAKASEFLNGVKELNTSSSVKVSDMVNSNQKYIYASDGSFESYFKGLFGPTKVSVLPIVQLQTDSVGIETGSAPQGSEQSESNSAETSGTADTKKKIINKGETALFKDGKYLKTLQPLDMKKINLIRGDYSTGSLIVENFSNDVFQDARLTFEIKENKVSYKTIFENGIPIFIIDSNITVSLSEIESQDVELERNIDFLGVTEDLKREIEFEFKRLISEGIDLMRENQTDIIDFYTKIYNFHKEDFLKFLEKLEDKEDYLNKIVFKVGITVFTQ